MNETPGDTLPTAFYFTVKFVEFENMDSSFQEVSGLKVTSGLEERKEGGENAFIHVLPGQPKYDDLVLKRCLMPNANLNKWCRNSINDFKIDPKNMQVSLLNGNGLTLASWNIVGAFPISWELSSLNSTSNELAIETLTLSYRYFKKEI